MSDFLYAMCNEAQFIIVNMWNQPSCASMDKENMEIQHIKNKILPFATKWMQLENFMLSKISQSQ